MVLLILSSSESIKFFGTLFFLLELQAKRTKFSHLQNLVLPRQQNPIVGGFSCLLGQSVTLGGSCRKFSTNGPTHSPSPLSREVSPLLNCVSRSPQKGRRRISIGSPIFLPTFNSRLKYDVRDNQFCERYDLGLAEPAKSNTSIAAVLFLSTNLRR